MTATPDGEHATWVIADIDDESTLARAFAGCESVIHCAHANCSSGTHDCLRAANAHLVVRLRAALEVDAPDRIPDDLAPATSFSEQSMRAGLPASPRFSCADLRAFQRTA